MLCAPLVADRGNGRHYAAKAFDRCIDLSQAFLCPVRTLIATQHEARENARDRYFLVNFDGKSAQVDCGDPLVHFRADEAEQAKRSQARASG